VDALELIVPPVAGLIGVSLGYVGTRRVSRIERAAAARAELQRALAAYLAAIYPLVAELRAMPDVRPTGLSEVMDRISGEAAVYVRSRRQIAKLGSRPFALMDRFVAAMANLQVLSMPAELATAIATANAYVEQLSGRRPNELKDRWPEIWSQLQSASSALRV
jgi:hypothetical protein